MLPYCTAIAQDEQLACVFGLRVWQTGECLTQWRARVFLQSANASRYLLFVDGVLVTIFYSFICFARVVVFLGSLGSLASSRRFADVFRRQ